ncbi:MAG: hypothetical protein ACOH1T_03335 [Microbacteriaceae bacterium]
MRSDLEKETPEMILEYILLTAVAAWGVLATVVVVQRDGLRRIPTAGR